MTGPDSNILNIHRERLDEDCERQPQLMFIWGEQLAMSRKRSKEAKNQVKLSFAEIGLAIRRSPDEFGLEKVTEASVEATILIHPDYQGAQEELIQAEYEEDILSEFVKALTDRGKEITNMITLLGQMYWSRPNTGGREVNREVATQAANQAIGSKPKGKKKPHDSDV